MPIDNTLYDQLAATWWDENEALSSLLTLVNPARFGYFREILLERLHEDIKGKKALDVGCGGGLLAEEFARLGYDVTGIDPSEPSIAIARTHALQQHLSIDYLTGSGEHLPFADASFDIVYCCDVLEHVRDLNRVIAEIARVLKRDGIFFFDTINRTLISRIITIYVLQEWKVTSVMPPNLHDWTMFIKPQELHTLLKRYGLAQQEITGLVPDTNPLMLIPLLVKRKRKKLPFKEVEKHVRLIRGNDTSNLYAGYAIKKAYLHEEGI